jgi:hypothetical protein
MDFDLDLFAEEIDRRSGKFLSAGIAWTFTHGPKDRTKCAAWVRHGST